MWHEKPTEHCVLRVADEEKKVVVVVRVVLSLSLFFFSFFFLKLTPHHFFAPMCYARKIGHQIAFKCDARSTAHRGRARQTRDANGRAETALGRPRPPGARRTRGAPARRIPVLHLHPLGPTGMPEENTGGHIQLTVRRVRGGDIARRMDTGDVSERQHREPVSDAEELFTVCGVLDGS